MKKYEAQKSLVVVSTFVNIVNFAFFVVK